VKATKTAGTAATDPGPSTGSRGRFLVLEGIDGCGKTTQLAFLSQWLPTSGLLAPGARLHLTREPGGTPLGQALRQLLLHPPEAAAPGGTTSLNQLDPDRLAGRILSACERGTSELVLPAKVRFLAGLIEWFPDLGRGLLARVTGRN